MSGETSTNGADSSESRERPDWYIPIKPIPDDYDGPTGIELLIELTEGMPELSDEMKEETKRFLDQFLVPRNS